MSALTLYNICSLTVVVKYNIERLTSRSFLTRDNLHMDQEQIRALLEQVRRGEVDTDAAMGRLKHMPFEDLGYAKVDHHRALRHGMPEVIFAKGKTPEQVAGIAEKVLEHSSNLLITRADR